LIYFIKSDSWSPLMEVVMARFDLSDEEWAVIQPLLPAQGRGAKRGDDRKILNGIFFILRTGAPWRDLPGRYGPPPTVYNRYVR
jgi:transposase